MSSPFNELTTHLLSPVMAKDCAIFLYKPGQDDQDFVTDYQTAYNVVMNPTVGYINIHTATDEAFFEILTYLHALYGPYKDEMICIAWD